MAGPGRRALRGRCPRRRKDGGQTARPEQLRPRHPPSSCPVLLVLRRDPLDDARLRRRTSDHIAFAVPADVAGLTDLTVAIARTIADDAQDLAVAVQMKELAVQAGADPRITGLGVEGDVADQVAHLERLFELAGVGVDDDPILFTVADPQIAIRRVDRDVMGHPEVTGAHHVAVDLADELAVLVQADDAGGAGGVPGIAGL